MTHQRQRIETHRLAGGYAIRNGRRLVNFSDNDYLGLSFHPHVIAAAAEALAQYGAGAGASRLVTGNHPFYTQLEQELADYKQTEDALVFGSGFLVNQGVVTALIDKGDRILADRLIHASLVDAIRLSGANFQRFHHNNLTHLEQLLQQTEKKRCWIITESFFSMDGDASPLDAMLTLAERYDAMLLVDDAHGFGVKKLEISNPCVIQTGTFSKAAGSYGGYVCASRIWIERLVNKARSLIYTTGLPPSVIAANLAALRIIRTQPELTAKPLENSQYFCELMGLPLAQSAIVPMILGDAQATLMLSQQLEEAGFLVTAIRPPTVPEGTSRLRITFSAVHQQEDIARLTQTLRLLHRVYPS
jgi:8-amino-7-oxononanoate synthase